MNIHPRHAKKRRLEVSWELLSYLLNLPDDVTIDAVQVDLFKSVVSIRVESERFSPIPEGGVMTIVPLYTVTKEPCGHRAVTMIDLDPQSKESDELLFISNTTIDEPAIVEAK